MERRILIATDAGLWTLGPEGARPIDALAGRAVTAIAFAGRRVWVLVDGRELWAEGAEAADGPRRWAEITTIEGPAGTCLAPTPVGLLIGTEQAHLLRLAGTQLTPIESFDDVAGREAWYTPWGDPADVRSISAEPAGAIYVNVHVGGVVRSRDSGASWTPTLDIEVDVHQVLAPAHPPGVVLVAAAVGLGVSRDGGDSWDFLTAGLHARYSRAVAVADGTVLVTASTGPSGRRSALHRRPLDGDGAFERVGPGLPTWFADNIDTACLAASGSVVVFGAKDGRVFLSRDRGGSWELLAKDLPAVRGVALG